jgi:putative transcriptional regulator
MAKVTDLRPRGRINRAKVEATTEEEIQRQIIEDGLDPNYVDKLPYRVAYSAAAVREKAGMSQEEFARAIGVPLATLRNWEQHRREPDPAAKSLLALIYDNPKRAFTISEPRASAPGAK